MQEDVIGMSALANASSSFLLSLARDPVLLFLIGSSFTFSVYTPAKSAVMDVVKSGEPQR